MIYSLQGRQRPLPQPEKDTAIPQINYTSNYDYYGLYQPIGIQFAKTLRGIGNKKQIQNNGQSVHLHTLCERAMNGNFAKDIMEEYTADGHDIELITIFRDLGNVYDIKQATFGARQDIRLTPQNINVSQRSYMNAINKFRELEDHRPKKRIDNLEEKS